MKTEIPVQKEIEPFISFFLDSRKKEIVVIDQLINDKNYTELEKIFHNLKGVSKSYGFPTLGEIAKEIEKLCSSKSHEEIVKKQNELKNFLSTYFN